MMLNRLVNAVNLRYADTSSYPDLEEVQPPSYVLFDLFEAVPGDCYLSPQVHCVHQTAKHR